MARFGKPLQQKLNDTGVLIGGVGPMRPHQTGKFFADWWPEARMENDFLMNPEVKKTKNFTGIPSVRMQDDAVITSMGKVMDRTKEHLGTADATIIRVRRRMLEAAKALRERGVIPPGVNSPELYKVRSCQAILPKDRSWQTMLDDWHQCRTTEHPTGGFKPLRSAPEGGFGRARRIAQDEER
jgi:phthalate 4,5-dioxygenase